MRAIALAIASVGVLLSPSTLHAAGDDTSAGTDTGTGDIEVRAVTGVVYTEGGDSGPRCSWRRYNIGRLEDSLGVAPPTPPRYAVPDSELTAEQLAQRNAERQAWLDTERRRRARTAITQLFGQPHHVYDVRCPGFTGTLRAVPVDINAIDLIAGVEDIAHGRITTPIPNVSPPLDATGYVNLGMWLAIQPQTVDPISAEAGPNAWITLTPTHDSIHFDLGNGDTVTCPGTGTPITDPDTTEQGPCGYTYRTSSPDDTPYTITIHTTWNLPFTSSSGPGTLGAFTRTATFDHNVDEIQTIGINN